MEAMEELRGKFQLTEYEKAYIEITAEEVKSVKKKGDLYLIGKPWVDKVINKGVIEAVMGKNLATEFQSRIYSLFP